MMPRASHPMVHPFPAPVVPAPAPAAQGQGQQAAPPVPAPAAQGQGQQAAAPAPAPAPAPAAQGQGPAPPAPAQAAAQVQGPNAPPGVLMRDYPGAPGTRSGLGLRLAQAVLAAIALASVASTDDFVSITAFRYFVPAVALQCLWSLALVAVDVYALLVGRSFRTPITCGIFSIGDLITGGLTLSAASASAGITVLINDDLEYCYGNPCPSLMAGTAMAFLSWFALAPCFVLNLGTAVYKLQRP